MVCNLMSGVSHEAGDDAMTLHVKPLHRACILAIVSHQYTYGIADVEAPDACDQCIDWMEIATQAAASKASQGGYLLGVTEDDLPF